MKNNIKKARERKNMTQNECADFFGVKLRAWQTYEQGVSEPKYELLCRIADKFGVTTDYLLGREPETNPFTLLDLEDKGQSTLEKYMQLPKEMRQIIFDTMIQLAEAAQNQPEKKRHVEKLGDVEDETAKAKDETSSA